jgi:hypothetical protein
MIHYEQISDKTQPIPVGIIANMDDDRNFEYICVVKVSKLIAISSWIDQFKPPTGLRGVELWIRIRTVS